MENRKPSMLSGEQEPIKVLHIITESNLGGAQRNTLLTVKGLAHPPYMVDLVAGPKGPGTPGRLVTAAKEAGLSASFLPALVRRLSPVKDLRALVRLFSIMRRRGYSIVHTHSTKAGFLGRLAAALAGVPVVIHTVHGFPFVLKEDRKTRFYLYLEKVFSRVTDMLITVGRTLEEELVQRKIVPRDKIVTIYSGIDFSRFEPPARGPAIRWELGLAPQSPLIGFVGRLSAQKAPENLVAAAPGILQRIPDAAFVLVGDGPSRKAIEKQIREGGLENRIFLLGERDDIPQLLSQFDVFALPSRWEGVGRALTEAMGMAVPVVACRVNGVPELVEDNVTGLLVSPDEIVPFADAVIRLLEDRDLAERLGRSGRDKVLRMMDAAAMVRGIENVYKECLTREGEGVSGHARLEKEHSERERAAL